VTPDLRELLIEWLPRQRWYSTKNADPRITALEVEVLSTTGGVHVARAMVCDEASDSPVVYQVPLTLHRDRASLPENALIGVSSDGWVYDGCADPVHAAWLLDRTTPGHTLHSARVLSGEQSNTSIICEVEDGGGGQRTVIAKVFRVLADGANPDIELQEVLSRAGTPRVPMFLGALRGAWTRAGESESGDLAVTQEFIAGAQDAWRVALDCLRTGEDFDASSLGTATAEVHRLLAAECGTREVRTEDRDALLAQWRGRAEAAAHAVEPLRRQLNRVEELYRRAARAPWPALQRVHGDYHLGQVIQAPRRGWVLLDFEGEPLRPLAERRLPDLALRDVAGMLRSFDYAAGAAETAGGVEWAESAREEFLEGYTSDAGDDPRDHGDLLAALELDKALYEAVYEARNRPSWLRIPLAAIERLLP
jgi:predicted trehalose synthase